MQFHGTSSIITLQSFFFFFFRKLSIFNTHMGEEKIFLKKLTAVYIQKNLTLGYRAHDLNLFNTHSIFNMILTHYFFFLEY